MDSSFNLQSFSLYLPFWAITINVKNISLGSEEESVEGVGKKRKVECQFCHGIINEHLLKKHVPKCELYSQLVLDGKQCKICQKKFAVMGSVHQHIGKVHQKELLELKDQ